VLFSGTWREGQRVFMVVGIGCRVDQVNDVMIYRAVMSCRVRRILRKLVVTGDMSAIVFSLSIYTAVSFPTTDRIAFLTSFSAAITELKLTRFDRSQPLPLFADWSYKN